MAEDLSTYNETDPDGAIEITSSRVTVNGTYGDADSYVYKDFGASFFDGISLDFAFRISSSSIDQASGQIGFANNVNDASGWTGHFLGVYTYYDNGAGKRYIWLLTDIDGDTYQISANTTYYCRLVRAAGNTSASLYIYSDSARTSLLDTLTISGLSTTTYRYLYAFANYNAGDAAMRWYGYYEEFSFQTKTTGQVRVIGMMM